MLKNSPKSIARHVLDYWQALAQISKKYDEILSPILERGKVRGPP